MPTEGSSDNPVNIGPHSDIVDVHWATVTLDDHFDVSVNCASQLPSAEGTPPAIIYSITTDPPDATQTVTTNVDSTASIGFGELLRTISYGVRITGATKVTLDIAAPTETPDLNFGGSGTIEYTPTEGSTETITALIARNPSGATSLVADPTMSHPTGVSLIPTSASAELIYDSSDAPRAR